jgi:hypothetical protein
MQGHLVADAAALASASLRKVSGGVGAAGGPRALMLFRGCPRQLGSTVLLRGSDAGQLRRAKRVAAFAAYAAYWGRLEGALLADQLAAAASAVLPGGGAPDAVAGLADAVASSSYLAAAEARGRQAILSPSAHVTVVMERGVSGAELDLTDRGAAEESGADDVGGAWRDDSPDSPASSDSTNLWVLPAEAAAATFTVSGSQSLGEGEVGENGGAGAAVFEVGSRSGAATSPPCSPPVPTPGSPQDPLHQAAKEVALRRLQLTGSEPPSPAAAAAADPAQPGEPTQALPRGQQQQQQQQPSDGEGEALATQLSRGASGVSSQLPAAEAPPPPPEAEASGGVREAPGARAYASQQLWLSISCKNPAKGILCEPPHAHRMDYYADTGGALLSCHLQGQLCPFGVCVGGGGLGSCVVC